MCFGYGARGEQKMIPVHYMDGRDSPVGRCEVETVGDIDRAIIDAFEKRWVVNVDEDGGVACRTCDDDCGHEEKAATGLFLHALFSFLSGISVLVRRRPERHRIYVRPNLTGTEWH